MSHTELQSVQVSFPILCNPWVETISFRQVMNQLLNMSCSGLTLIPASSLSPWCQRLWPAIRDQIDAWAQIVFTSSPSDGSDVSWVWTSSSDDITASRDPVFFPRTHEATHMKKDTLPRDRQWYYSWGVLPTLVASDGRSCWPQHTRKVFSNLQTARVLI